MGSRRRVNADDIAENAARLREQWTKLAREHLSGGGGCSCGYGTGGVRLEDFEADILDYLAKKYADVDDVASLIAAAATPRPGERGGIPPLLDAIASRASGRPAAPTMLLLGDLARSLDSFAEMHRRH